MKKIQEILMYIHTNILGLALTGASGMFAHTSYRVYQELGIETTHINTTGVLWIGVGFTLLLFSGGLYSLLIQKRVELQHEYIRELTIKAWSIEQAIKVINYKVLEAREREVGDHDYSTGPLSIEISDHEVTIVDKKKGGPNREVIVALSASITEVKS